LPEELYFLKVILSNTIRKVGLVKKYFFKTYTLTMTLAIQSYEKTHTLVDSQETLNLSWTLDERELLSADLSAIISNELHLEVQGSLPYIYNYYVKDPYGEELLKPAIADYFSIDEQPISITCGAGVNSLLHAISGIVNRGGVIHILENAYPDLPHWVNQRNGICIPHQTIESVENTIINLTNNSSIVFLERPSIFGNELSDINELRNFCEKMLNKGIQVLIDESNANYYPPSFSAATLITDLENIHVIRGVSKAFGLGGLRFAYCISSIKKKKLIQDLVPPLLASSLSLRIGKKILELGDLTEKLRHKIIKSRKKAIQLFSSAQIEELVFSSDYLPYIFIQNKLEYIQDSIEKKGISGKWHPISSGQTHNFGFIYRLSVPLTSKRMNLLEAKFKS
jgi:histidinol-phosphate/aromatic aminotransferase/cobyric acid decarboxylase-like protein